MKETEFCYWLQGFFELTDAESLSEQQVKIIRDHLKLVFEKKTPNYTWPTTPGLNPNDFNITLMNENPNLKPKITC